MFDAHIQYFCYKNEASDDFGVGYIGNKEFWVHLLNTWNKNDKRSHKYTIEEWDEFTLNEDFRGCVLAEVEPDNLGSYVVRWVDGDDENVMQITNNGEIFWENNPQNVSSVPRWVTRLKNQLRES